MPRTSISNRTAHGKTALTSLRTPTPHDAGLIAVLGRQAFGETFHHYTSPQAVAAFLDEDYDSAGLAQSLADPALHWRLVEQDGIAAGFMKWGACKLPLTPLHPPQAELHRLYVLKAFQGHGLGRILMDEAMTRMREGGSGEICLGVWEGNDKAKAFYTRYGFEKAGEYNYAPIGKQTDREWIMRKFVNG